MSAILSTVLSAIALAKAEASAKVEVFSDGGFVLHLVHPALA